MMHKCKTFFFFCTKIIVDSVDAVCVFLMWFIYLNTARVEYDAYRTDLEELNLGPRDANTVPKIEVSQQQFQTYREKYERMRNDVSVKLKFLEENKVG